MGAADNGYDHSLQVLEQDPEVHFHKCHVSCASVFRLYLFMANVVASEIRGVWRLQKATV